MSTRGLPGGGEESVESRLSAIEKRLGLLEEWRSEVTKANPHLDTVLDPTPRGEASDE
jgi:hypothetical protein